jgi:hypothetical protein
VPVPDRSRDPERATEDRRSVWRTERAKDLSRRRAEQAHPLDTWCGPVGRFGKPPVSDVFFTRLDHVARPIVQLVARRSPSRHCWINEQATAKEPYRAAQRSTVPKPNPASPNWNRLPEFDSWTEAAVDGPAVLPNADTR